MPGVTADSTVWTADTTCVTADGRVICIPAIVAEAAGAVETFDADVVAGGAVIDADVLEAADAFDTADAISSVAADAVEPANALDVADAVADVAAAAGYVITGFDAAFSIAPATTTGYVITGFDAAFSIAPATTTTGYVITGFDAAFVVESAEQPVFGGGGGFVLPPRPFPPVVGYGYGILPRLEGEAHGVVGVAGQSTAHVLVRAAAVGACGQAGNAAVVLKCLTVEGKGAVGARGSGNGMITKFSGSATGQHDDDEAAVVAFLLAA